MCGRFVTSQLADFNSDYHIWHNQTNPTFQSKFLYALVLAFGLSLFSCSPSNDQHVVREIQEITSIIDTITKVDTTQNTLSSSVDSTKISDQQNQTCPPTTIEYFEMGELEYTPEVEHEMTKGEITIQNTSEFNDSIMGEFKVKFEDIKPAPIIEPEL
jgi:hypothetical protein